MVESVAECMEEIEEVLCQLRALGTLTYAVAQNLSDATWLKPDWCHSGKLMVGLAEEGLEAASRLNEELEEKSRGKLMGSKWKSHSPSVKAKVVLEATKGLKSVHQPAREYEVNPNLVSKWKKPLINQMEVFERGASPGGQDQAGKEARLYEQIARPLPSLLSSSPSISFG